MTRKEAKRLLHPLTSKQALSAMSSQTAAQTLEEAGITACEAMERLDKFENWLADFKYSNYHICTKEEILLSLESALGEKLIQKKSVLTPEKALCSAKDLAKYIVAKCQKDGCPVTNLQLQKILFCAYKEFALFETPLFAERFEAWKFGPCIPEVYFLFSGYGGVPIQSVPYNSDSLVLDIHEQRILENVINKTRVLSPWDFAKMVLVEGGAWERTFDNGAGDHKRIPVEFIKDEVLEKTQEERDGR